MADRTRLMQLYRRLLNRFGPQNWWPGDTPFEVAVGAVLTQNTNWGNVERAIRNLKADKSLSARAIHAMPHARLASLIRPAGYYNIKARRLKHFVGFLMDSYGGSMKRMAREETGRARQLLLGVNGVGPETADSIILYALDKPVFVIDAYTKRVLARHGIGPNGKARNKDDYESYRAMFEQSIRRDAALYNEYHALFVAAGKHYCRPRQPRCSLCPLEGF
jgi:endonuclease-3 related protein